MGRDERAERGARSRATKSRSGSTHGSRQKDNRPTTSSRRDKKDRRSSKKDRRDKKEQVRRDIEMLCPRRC